MARESGEKIQYIISVANYIAEHEKKQTIHLLSFCFKIILEICLILFDAVLFNILKEAVQSFFKTNGDIVCSSIQFVNPIWSECGSSIFDKSITNPINGMLSKCRN